MGKIETSHLHLVLAMIHCLMQKACKCLMLIIKINNQIKAQSDQSVMEQHIFATCCCIERVFPLM